MQRTSRFSIPWAVAMSIVLAACGGDDKSGGSTSGGAVESCNDLCALAPVSSQIAACVSETIAQKGYNTSDPRCSDANTPNGCTACYDAIGVTDADCAAVHAKCF